MSYNMLALLLAFSLNQQLSFRAQ